MTKGGGNRSDDSFPRAEARHTKEAPPWESSTPQPRSRQASVLSLKFVE